MTSTDLHRLAIRFCDEDASTRDVSVDGAMEYRLFLSRFLVYVAQQRPKYYGPCSACGDGDTGLEYHSHDNVLQFDLRREGDSATT